MVEPKRIVNPNLVFLRKCFLEGKTGAILEGSSRSGKTWSSVDFIVWLCSVVEEHATINIIRETYSSFKTTLFEDFNRRLPAFGIQSPFMNRENVTSFWLFGVRINFLGADNDSVVHGVGSDYTYFNEMLDIPENVYNQTTQRCRKFWWGDYNPKATVHWVYDKVCKRRDVGFLKTTFLDNPFISDNEKKKILSYEPTHPDDRHIEDIEQRRPHPINIEDGTADDYMWQVYGLGVRCAPEGLIFRNVKWLDEFPKNIEQHFYGLDFGYTIDPSALSHGGLWGVGKNGKRNLVVECLFYQPTESFGELKPLLDKYLGKQNKCWADPSGEYGERGMISTAQQSGYKIYSAATGPGTIMYGISIIKDFNLYVVRSEATELEQGNYRFKEVHGIKVEEPVDEFNHWWDATRMFALSDLEKYTKRK